MTCLVAIKYKEKDKDGVLVAADSLSSSNRKLSELSSMKNKIIKFNGIIIACCGTARIGDIIEYQIEPYLDKFPYNPKPADLTNYIGKHFIPTLIELMRDNKLLDDSNRLKNDNSLGLVIAFYNQIYCIYSDFAFMKSDEYASMGSGEKYALGSLDTSYNIIRESKFLSNKNLILNKEQAQITAARAIQSAAKFDFYVDNNIRYEFLEL